MSFKVCEVVGAQELIRAGVGAGSGRSSSQNRQYPRSHLLSQTFIFFRYFESLNSSRLILQFLS